MARDGYVEYVRLTDLNTRQITRFDWEQVGVDHDTISWDASNNWKVPADKISDEAWPHIEADTGLRYVPKEESDGTTVPEPQVRRARASSNK